MSSTSKAAKANYESLPVATEEMVREALSAWAYSFSILFCGNPKGFYLRHDDGSYKAVHRELTVLDLVAHLGALPNTGVLAVPVLPDGTCHWGAIDVDRHNPEDNPVDWPRLARRVTELDLPLVVCSSKNGKGAHLFIFFKDENLPAGDARRLLQHYADLLGFANAEIFPKQDDLDTNEGLGSGINLPYRRTPPPGMRMPAYGFDKDGEPLDALTDDFIDLANERKVYGALLLARLPKPADKHDREKSAESDEEPGETSVENAVAYLDRAVTEFEAMTDERQRTATAKCYWLGRVIGAKTGDPRLTFEVIKKRITDALRKTKWPPGKFEVIERQLREGMTKPVKIVEDDEIEIRDWPEPPAQEAFAGLVGDFTKLWQEHTEASPVALAAQFIALYGHAVGRNPFFAVGGDDHHTNLEISLVGPTSFARKGQSYGCVRHTFSLVHLALGIPALIEARGLSSGEGLISAVRDQRFEPNPKTGQPKMVDEGVNDKRLLVFESEFASVLRRMVREGNTLSEVIRQAWENGNLGTMTRTAPLKASEAHITLITHVTPADLQLYLNDVSTVNGFANRFIFLATKRVRSLPNPKRPEKNSLATFAARLARAIEFGMGVNEIIRSSEAESAWETLYERLNSPRIGRNHNAVVARAPAHVLRLSMIYALLDGSCVIEAKHLASAAALWDYAERTSRYVFGNSLGDKVAEQILEVLKTEPNGLTTREIRARVYAKKHVPDALRLLLDNEQIREERTKRSTPGRKGQRWFAL